jgi:DNA-binding beta-propeller fold protein YncE
VGAGKAPTGIAVSPDAKSVYVTDRGVNQISQYSVAPNGSLHPMMPARVATGARPQGIAISPDGKSVYVADSGSHYVSQYAVPPGS